MFISHYFSHTTEERRCQNSELNDSRVRYDKPRKHVWLRNVHRPYTQWYRIFFLELNWILISSPHPVWEHSSIPAILEKIQSNQGFFIQIFFFPLSIQDFHHPPHPIPWIMAKFRELSQSHRAGGPRGVCPCWNLWRCVSPPTPEISRTSGFSIWSLVTGPRRSPCLTLISISKCLEACWSLSATFELLMVEWEGLADIDFGCSPRLA